MTQRQNISSAGHLQVPLFSVRAVTFFSCYDKCTECAFGSSAGT